ncbi:SDR family NAD(P)-dependent oxidoreductase [Cellulomonas sp. NPDC055163]
MTVTDSRDARGTAQHPDAEPLPTGEQPAAVVQPDEQPDAQPDAHAPGVDDADLATFLRVVDHLVALPHDHPQHAVARRATSGLFKAVKKQRRTQKRAAISAADRAVVAATATGSPGRIDDETLGIPLVSSVRGASAGTLLKARPCYICKELYSAVDAFYHQLCPSCAALNHAKRDARTDLTGRRALLTGGRAKIGMYIALRLLRDGAHTTITTRFPRDAARRFAAMPDAADWIDRLEIVGIDLRDPAQVVALADSVAAAGPLDVLINNAAQTVRRSPGAYSRLADAEHAPLPAGPLPAIRTFGHTSDAHPRALAGAVSELTSPTLALAAADAGALTAQALTAHAASLERLVAGTSIDAGGLVPDTHDTNSWVATVDEVDPMELLEVQLCNQTAPFILVSRLRPAMKAASARRTYVVNVSAMEGVFSRGYKGPGHPHTNMAKAALNMLTRTSAAELATDGILMTAVDTGWITDERPHPTKVRLAEEGFHAPLDLVDGAARVYDPIVRGEAGEDLFGCFLKDYARSAW